jgi:ATP-dependent exoDNAse (exonuclease V) alpha subunit
VKLKGRKDPISISRTQFPLVPRFCCTAHKSQGKTLNRVIVDLIPQKNRVGPIEINFSYVPLSRVRTLEDLTILRPFDPSILKARINRDCVAMMNDFKARDVCRDM